MVTEADMRRIYEAVRAAELADFVTETKDGASSAGERLNEMPGKRQTDEGATSESVPE